MNLFQVRAVKLDDETPNQAPHIHNEYEIFCFLAGDAMYSVEGTIYRLNPGDILVMKNTEIHNLTLRKKSPYKRITVHFKPVEGISQDMVHTFLSAFIDRPIGHYNLYSSTHFQTDQWMYYLNKMCEETNTIKQQVYLMALLQEISSSFPLLKEKAPSADSDIVNKVTHYIDRHLADSLNLDVICQRFFTSEAQLTRNFKKNLGTTVGDYILTKRLVLARDLIESGEKPTTAHLKCGFKDYSSFYRAYKKKFGCIPKTTKSGTHATNAVFLERTFEI